MRLHFLLISTFLIFTGCNKEGPSLGPGDQNVLASAAQEDCGFVRNSYGERVSWKKDIPLTLNIYNDYPADYVDALEKAAAHWNDAAGMTLLRFAHHNTAQPVHTGKKDGANNVLWMHEWAENTSRLQGVTNLYWKSNQLLEADVLVNDKNFNFFIENPISPSEVHLESLLLHELGHTLGLKHRSTVPSVMWAILNGGVKRNELTEADRTTLKCEY